MIRILITLTINLDYSMVSNYKKKIVPTHVERVMADLERCSTGKFRQITDVSGEVVGLVYHLE